MLAEALGRRGKLDNSLLLQRWGRAKVISLPLTSGWCPRETTPHGLHHWHILLVGEHSSEAVPASVGRSWPAIGHSPSLSPRPLCSWIHWEINVVAWERSWHAQSVLFCPLHYQASISPSDSSERRFHVSAPSRSLATLSDCLTREMRKYLGISV